MLNKVYLPLLCSIALTGCATKMTLTAHPSEEVSSEAVQLVIMSPSSKRKPTCNNNEELNDVAYIRTPLSNDQNSAIASLRSHAASVGAHFLVVEKIGTNPYNDAYAYGMAYTCGKVDRTNAPLKKSIW